VDLFGSDHHGRWDEAAAALVDFSQSAGHSAGVKGKRLISGARVPFCRGVTEDRAVYWHCDQLFIGAVRGDAANCGADEPFPRVELRQSAGVLLRVVRVALDGLSPKRKEVLYLVIWNGLLEKPCRHCTLARALGRTEATFSRQLREGLQHVRDMLARAGFTPADLAWVVSRHPDVMDGSPTLNKWIAVP